jgi:hypothetical protein
MANWKSHTLLNQVGSHVVPGESVREWGADGARFKFSAETEIQNFMWNLLIPNLVSSLLTQCANQKLKEI